MKFTDAELATNRPPFERFHRAFCRGSMALGSACGNCERCDWERQRIAYLNNTVASDSQPTPAAVEKIEAILNRPSTDRDKGEPIDRYCDWCQGWLMHADGPQHDAHCPIVEAKAALAALLAENKRLAEREHRSDREAWWLIEATPEGQSMPVYVDGVSWTSDPNAAARFHSEDAANAAFDALWGAGLNVPGNQARVVEHGWMYETFATMERDAFQSENGRLRGEVLEAHRKAAVAISDLADLHSRLALGEKDTERMNWLDSRVDHQAADAYLRLEFATNMNLREAVDAELPHPSPTGDP